MPDEVELPQFCSSLPSVHSTTLLHLAEIGTHCLFEQVNCVEEHPTNNCKRWMWSKPSGLEITWVN